jgi:hypothetical protein
MTYELRKATARANGAKSRGPKKNPKANPNQRATPQSTTHRPGISPGCPLDEKHQWSARHPGHQDRTRKIERLGMYGGTTYITIESAKDNATQRFYEHYGFNLLPGEDRRLFLPIALALRH